MHIQSAPGGKVNILGGHSISYSTQKGVNVNIHFFLLRMTDTMTSQNTDLPSWDSLYEEHFQIHFNYTNFN
jgi:hypothetical protein